MSDYSMVFLVGAWIVYGLSLIFGDGGFPQTVALISGVLAGIALGLLL